MSEFRFDPATYLDDIRADVPVFDEFQDAVASATRGVRARRVLELGTGTGETARRVLDIHPEAQLVGIDENERMLAAARARVDADLLVSRLEDALPEGPFDLVFSALAVHHLDAAGKRDLFRRVAGALNPRGRFVLGDVVVPEREEDSIVPLTPDFDRPDTLEDQLAWLQEAGFETRTTWALKDLAVVRAHLRG